MGEGELLCTGSALPFSILPISLRLSPVPQRSHAAHWAAGRGGHLLPGSPGGLGCGLQWRAAASRWNFLTNTRRRRPPLPGRGAARGSLARAPRQVRGARAVTQGEGRWTVHVDPAGFPGLEAKGIPRFPLRTRGPAQCGPQEFPAPHLRLLESAQYHDGPRDRPRPLLRRARSGTVLCPCSSSGGSVEGAPRDHRERGWGRPSPVLRAGQMAEHLRRVR